MKPKILYILSEAAFILSFAMFVFVVVLLLESKEDFKLKETLLTTNHAAYQVGDTIAVRLDYLITKPTKIYVNFSIRDGIQFHGNSMEIELDRGMYDTDAVLWIDALQPPSLAYSGDYWIEGEISYYENILKKVTYKIQSKPFYVLNPDNPFEQGFDDTALISPI
jgi:hypothetical protein